jgi:hypothetical protein
MSTSKKSIASGIEGLAAARNASLAAKYVITGHIQALAIKQPTHRPSRNDAARGLRIFAKYLRLAFFRMDVLDYRFYGSRTLLPFMLNGKKTPVSCDGGPSPR